MYFGSSAKRRRCSARRGAQQSSRRRSVGSAAFWRALALPPATASSEVNALELAFAFALEANAPGIADHEETLSPASAACVASESNAPDSVCDCHDTSNDVTW